MRPFIEDASNGSVRDTIYRAILAYPEEEFTTKNLYEFICFDFPLNDAKWVKESKPIRRSATTPRNAASLGALLAQAEREGVVKRIKITPRAIWKRLHKEDCRIKKDKPKLMGNPVVWGDDH